MLAALGIVFYRSSKSWQLRIPREISFRCSRKNILLLVFFPQPTKVKAPSLPGGHNSAGDSTTPGVEAAPTDKAPKLDGTLNDPPWELASPITDFWQRESDDFEVKPIHLRHPRLSMGVTDPL
jgi:hypothetical protein